jgi:hypothetical protein
VENRFSERKRVSKWPDDLYMIFVFALAFGLAYIMYG